MGVARAAVLRDRRREHAARIPVGVSAGLRRQRRIALLDSDSAARLRRRALRVRDLSDVRAGGHRSDQLGGGYLGRRVGRAPNANPGGAHDADCVDRARMVSHLRPRRVPVEPARLHGVSQSRIDPVRRIHRSLRRVRADRVLQRRRLRRDFPPRRISPADHQPERVDRDDDRAGRIRRVANQRHQGRAAIGQLQGRDGAGEHPAVAQVGSQVPAAKATACTRTKPPTRRNAAPT